MIKKITLVYKDVFIRKCLFPCINSFLLLTKQDSLQKYTVLAKDKVILFLKESLFHI